MTEGLRVGCDWIVSRRENEMMGESKKEGHFRQSKVGEQR